MSIRRTMTGRRGTAAVAITTGLVLTVAGCSSGDDGGDDSDKSKAPSQQENKDEESGQSGDESNAEPLAEVKGGDDISLTVSSAKREDGGFVTLRGKITNEGQMAWSGVKWRSDETEVGNANPASVAGARLVDKKGKKRYYILRDTEGRCLCTSFKGGIRGGDSETWYAQFPAPPEGNNEVDFQIADLPAANITISGE